MDEGRRAAEGGLQVSQELAPGLAEDHSSHLCLADLWPHSKLLEDNTKLHIYFILLELILNILHLLKSVQ